MRDKRDRVKPLPACFPFDAITIVDCAASNYRIESTIVMAFRQCFFRYTRSDPLLKLFFLKKKSRNAKKIERDPLVLPGIVRYAVKRKNLFGSVR